MNAPGKTMLSVTSILFIVFGALGILFYGIGLACASWATSNAPWIEEEWDALTGSISAVGIAAIVILAVAFLKGALGLVLGIVGLKSCADAAKANFFIVTGSILCGLQFIFAITVMKFFGIFGLALPILFIVGGVMNRKAAAVAEPAEPVQ